ncbi:MAG: beta-ketoacyl-ACP synthase II [Candidatus Binatia bacterium]
MSGTDGRRRRVVVTGLGLVTPLGTGTEANWEALMTGRSGIGAITRFDASSLPARVAGEVRDFAPERFVERKDVKKMDPFIHFAIASAQMAVEDAGLALPLAVPERCGVIVGVGIGGINTLESACRQIFAEGDRRISPFLVPRLIPNMAAGQIALRFGARGPSYATTSACASGAHALGEAFMLIRDGRQDAMLTGGAEAPLCWLSMAGFAAMRALATGWNDDPTRASRPFDAKREGFVMGEGAGMLVLEESEHARRRGAHVYAEIVGYGANCDAYHMTQPAPEGAGAAECMALALADGSLSPDHIGYVNAHGTGTPYNDEAETKAIKRVFGGHAAHLAVSSTKSMTGHLLGAAGAVEAAFTVLALEREVLPPTINLDDPDPACDLDYVPNHPRSQRAEAALSNSFGFGGTNVSLAFRRAG